MHAYVTYVADRAATREVEALHDYYQLGRLVAVGELSYETARDELTEAFRERDLAASTAKVYLSQGFALAQLFDTFDELEEFADDECNGSRSLKRIYDATRVREESPADESPAEPADESPATALVDVILANLAMLTDAADIARVRDAAAAMLAPAAAAA